MRALLRPCVFRARAPFGAGSIDRDFSRPFSLAFQAENRYAFTPAYAL
jgi:hypothetical protein